MNEWVSVKDGMPEIAETVLVCCSGVVSIAWRDRMLYEEDVFWEDAYADHLQGITHWMPLPEPPHSQNQQEEK